MLEKLFRDLSEKAAEAGFELSADIIDEQGGFFVLTKENDRIPFHLRHNHLTKTVIIREGAAFPMKFSELVEVTPITVTNYTALVILGILLRAQIYQFSKPR